MSQSGNPSSKMEVSVNTVNAVRKRMDDLVIAWARDQRSGLLRYILELTEEERGKHCGCVCISCGQALTAVNAAK